MNTLIKLMKKMNDVTTSCHNYWGRDSLPSMITEVEEQIQKASDLEKSVLEEYLKHLNALKHISETLGARRYTFQTQQGSKNEI